MAQDHGEAPHVTRYEFTPGNDTVTYGPGATNWFTQGLGGQDWSITGFEVTSPGGAITINAGNTLTNGSGGIDMSLATQNLTINPALMLGAPQSWTVTNLRTLTVGGIVSGSAALIKAGGGSVALNGNNTYSGGTTINGGRIVMGHDNAVGGGTITLNGGELQRNVVGAVITNTFSLGAGGGAFYGAPGNYMTLSGAIGGTGSLNMYDLVYLTNTNNNFGGNISINNSGGHLRTAGNAIPDTAAVTVNSGANFRLDGGETIAGIAGAGATWGVGADQTLTISNGVGTSSSFSGNFTDNGPGNRIVLIKTGGGTQEVTSAAVGNLPRRITVNGGVLKLAAGGLAIDGSGWGNGAPITVNAGGTLQLAGNFEAGHTRLIALNGGTLHSTYLDNGDSGNYVNTLALTNGALITGNRIRAGYVSTANVTVGGTSASTNAAGFTLVKSGSYLLNVNVADVTGNATADFVVSGLIADYSGLAGTPIVKSGAGTMLLSVNNTFAGNTTISQGAIAIRDAGSLGTAGTVTLNDASTGSTNTALMIDTAGAAANITFARPIVIAGSGSGTSTLGSVAENPVGTRQAIFSSAITLNNRDVYLRTGAGDQTAFTGGLSGTGNVYIANGSLTGDTRGNGGNRVIFNTTAKTFVGDLTVLAGTAANYTVLQINTGNMIPDASSVTLQTNAVLRLYGNDTINGLSGTGRVRGVVNTYTLTVGAGGASAAFAGVMENDPHDGGVLAFTKTGAGTQTLSGSNTYTGVTTVNGGVLRANHQLAFGAHNSAVGSVVVQAGGTVDINGIVDLNKGFTLAGTGSAGQGALVNFGAGQNGNFISTPNIALSANATVGGSGNIMMVSPGYAANTLTLSNYTLTVANSDGFYLANTTVTTGTIAIAAGARLCQNGSAAASTVSAAAITLANAANTRFELNGKNLSVGSLAGGGTAGGTVALGANTLTVGALGTSTEFGGVIGGTGGLTKTGAGTLTLTNANTYTGPTTVNAGTLALSAAGKMGGTAVTVSNAANLVNNGTISGPVTQAPGATGIISGTGVFSNNVTVTGTLSPGGSPGYQFYNGNLTLGSAADTRFELNGGTGWRSDLLNNGSGYYDAMDVGGNLTLDGTVTVLWVDLFEAVDGEVFNLLDWGTINSAGFNVTSDLVLPGFTVNPGLSWDTSNFLSDGTLTVVPEPGTFGTLALFSVALLLRRRLRG